MKGNVRDMSVADLIQHNCQDNRLARLTIDHDGRQAVLFFKDGSVVHAELDDLRGEEAVYRALDWEEGQFDLEVGLEPPATTITRSWSGLLLEAARRVDEMEKIESTKSYQKEGANMPPKKRSELLAEALDELLASSSDIEGAAVVGVDGLVYSANVPQRGMDVDMVGAASAAVLGLSRRSVGQLNRGDFAQTMIQGSGGNIIVSSLNPETIFIALTPPGVNLGMAFAEVRSMIRRLSEIL